MSRVDTIFNSIGAAVGKTSAFVAEQVPDIALQYVAYGRVYLTCIIVITTLIMLFNIGVWIYAAVDKSNVDHFPILLATGTVSVGGVVPIFVANFKNFVMVWFAPKIWVMTEIVHLVK